VSKVSVPGDKAQVNASLGPSPRATPGDAQLLVPRTKGRELYPSNWLKVASEITLADEGGVLDCTPVDLCSLGLLCQTREGYKVLINWDRIAMVKLKEHTRRSVCVPRK
jgi:hypothetical protein